VVIDEIGRGTSSTDGVVIAQAILESLLEEICCRCLFATHYHQLSDIDHRRMRNVSVQAQYVDGVVVFTHRIVEGAANSSYGLEVARLAGLPESLLKRAENLLITEVQLERSGSLTGKREYDDGLLPYRVYKSEEECVNYQYGQAVKERLSAVDPNLITPVDALLVLYDLKNIK
jgi:DNA mismatch repair protein MutS